MWPEATRRHVYVLPDLGTDTELRRLMQQSRTTITQYPMLSAAPDAWLCTTVQMVTGRAGTDATDAQQSALITALHPHASGLAPFTATAGPVPANRSDVMVDLDHDPPGEPFAVLDERVRAALRDVLGDEGLRYEPSALAAGPAGPVDLASLAHHASVVGSHERFPTPVPPASTRTLDDHEGKKHVDIDVRRSPVLYRAIADALRQDIQDGRYKPGDSLPTSRELATRFSVSKDCIRDALGVLRDEGVVIPDGARPVRVPPTVERAVVVLGAGAVATVRMPSPDERERLDIDAMTGVPVIVITTPGQPDACYPANRFVIQAADPEGQASV